jgi:hypothetical protein
MQQSGSTCNRNGMKSTNVLAHIRHPSTIHHQPESMRQAHVLSNVAQLCYESVQPHLTHMVGWLACPS